MSGITGGDSAQVNLFNITPRGNKASFVSNHPQLNRIGVSIIFNECVPP